MELTSSKNKAINLRIEKRLSLKAISEKLNISKSTASIWLKDYPLTKNERQLRQSANGVRQGGWNKKDRGYQSKFYDAIQKETLDNQRKAKIAETAISFRLALYGFNIHSPLFDGDRADWIVDNPKSGKLSRLQVRCVHEQRQGLPTVSLRCFEGRYKKRQFVDSECDILTGYDLFTDTAYVFLYKNLQHLTSFVTITPEAAENWSLIP